MKHRNNIDDLNNLGLPHSRWNDNIGRDEGENVSKCLYGENTFKCITRLEHANYKNKLYLEV